MATGQPPAPEALPDAAALDRWLSLDRIALPSAPRPVSGRSDAILRRVGLPLGVAVFLALILPKTPAGLDPAGQAAAAAFALALVWWVTEPVPTYVTSLVLMILLVFTQAQQPVDVLGVFGLDVIWLNILAFILSAMLVRTHLARRLALSLISRFGRRLSHVLGAFVVLQLVLAPLIPATAARAALTMPLMLAAAAMYGSTIANPGNAGRNVMLLNLTAISVLSSTVMTGSAANLLAVGFLESMAGERVYYFDWLRAAAPIAILTVAAAWWLGPRIILPVPRTARQPVSPSGMAAVERERAALGPMDSRQRRAIAIFVLVLALWATDRFHEAWFGLEFGAPIAAMIGVVLALWPRHGVINWDETDIPWHLLVFSAGAYAGGFALERTGAAEWAVNGLFGQLDLQRVRFGIAYAVVTAIMLYSHLFSTSKTVRTVIMVPIIILLARGLGWSPISLALPAAFTIDWVIGLPISGKPNVILYGSGLYSARDNLRYGLVVCTIGYLLMLLAGATWFHWLGITPAFTALPP